MWAIRKKPTNCTNPFLSVKLRWWNWFVIFPDSRSPVAHRPTFSHPGNPNKVARGHDKDLTPPAETCANILRDYGAYMARQNGRGSSRPWVLNRTATSLTDFRVSTRNCLLQVASLLSFFSLLLLWGTVSFAQEGDVDSIHITPRIETTAKPDPAA